VAAQAHARLTAEAAAGAWVIVATAHPAKFREIIEPLIGRSLAMPDSLAQLFERPVRCTEIDSTLSALKASL
jgi:threonine synthase